MAQFLATESDREWMAPWGCLAVPVQWELPLDLFTRDLALQLRLAVCKGFLEAAHNCSMAQAVLPMPRPHLLLGYPTSGFRTAFRLLSLQLPILLRSGTTWHRCRPSLQALPHLSFRRHRSETSQPRKGQKTTGKGASNQKTMAHSQPTERTLVSSRRMTVRGTAPMPMATTRPHSMLRMTTRNKAIRRTTGSKRTAATGTDARRRSSRTTRTSPSSTSSSTSKTTGGRPSRRSTRITRTQLRPPKTSTRMTLQVLRATDRTIVPSMVPRQPHQWAIRRMVIPGPLIPLRVSRCLATCLQLQTS
eukprot:Rmarinus@m.20047